MNYIGIAVCQSYQDHKTVLIRFPKHERVKYHDILEVMGFRYFVIDASTVYCDNDDTFNMMLALQGYESISDIPKATVWFNRSVLSYEGEEDNAGNDD